MVVGKLTDKQYFFALEYPRGVSGEQAAIKAGYSLKSARKMAIRNLDNPDIGRVMDKVYREALRCYALPMLGIACDKQYDIFVEVIKSPEWERLDVI